MNNYTREDILRMVEEEDVGFIRLQFTDIFGTMKNIAITTSQLEKALDNEIMFDGSSIEGFARVEESDMYLYPNLNTFEIFPWRPQQGKVARLICDVYKPDGTPYESDPRYILKKVMEDANVGIDFILCRNNKVCRDVCESLVPAGEGVARASRIGGCFCVAAVLHFLSLKHCSVPVLESYGSFGGVSYG